VGKLYHCKAFLILLLIYNNNLGINPVTTDSKDETYKKIIICKT